MRTATFLRALLIAFLTAATLCHGQTSDVLSPVTARYRGKVIALRKPVPGTRISYEAARPMPESRNAEWQDALILCKDFKLKGRAIEVKGERLWFGYDPEAGKLVTVRTSGVRVTIIFDAPPDTAAVSRELQRIFFDPNTPLADVAPSYWQACLRGSSAGEKPLRRCTFKGVREADSTTEVTSPNGGDVARQATVFVRSVDADGVPHYGTESRTVYRVGPKVSQPKSLYTPDPGYTEWALSKRVSGSCALRMIINETGRVDDVQVIRPLGYGLDDVSAWMLKGGSSVPQPSRGGQFRSR